MMDNERRADLGALAVTTAADQTGVSQAEPAETAVRDVLAYIAHFCDRLGLSAQDTFRSALHSYHGDFEDGPAAQHAAKADVALAEQTDRAVARMTSQAPEQLRADLQRVLDYAQPDEEHDFEHGEWNGPAEGHVATPMRRLRAWLESVNVPRNSTGAPRV